MDDLNADIHHEDGTYWAEVAKLPGCFASGESIPELIEALTEAVSLYLTPAQQEPVSTRVATVGLRVAKLDVPQPA